MAARYFNWKLATVLVVAVGVFTVAAYALHRWQVTNRAVQALPLGEAAYARQDWDEAAIQLGKYLGVNADDVGVLLKYAQAQRQRRPWSGSNIVQARDAYRSVLRLDGNNLEAVRGLLEVYLSILNAAAEAEPVARNYLQSNDNVEIRRMHAEALRLLRRPQEAAEVLQKNLDQHPDDVQSYEMRGWLAKNYPDLGGRPAALWFDDAVARNPQSALAYLARAGFLWQQRDRSKALADLAQAQKCALPDKETRSRLVTGLINAKLLDQAREQLQAWQAQDPAEPLLWQEWAILAKGANVPDEMSMVAQAGLKALVAQPWDFLPKAAELLLLSNHVEEAKNYIVQMREKGMAPPAVPYLEGLVADREGRPREAVVNWRKAIALGYQPAEARYLLAVTLARLGDVQSAVGELRILLTELPGYLHGRMVLAQFLVQTRDWEEVLNEARQARQLSEDYPEVRGAAILLELQARVQLLAADPRPAASKEEDWQKVATQLAELDKANQGSLAVKLLQTQTVLMRRQFAGATALLTELESKYPPDVRVAVLHADLCAAQGQKEEAKSRFQAAVTKFPQALEPVRGLARLLDEQNQRPECEAVIREGLARIQEPPARRSLGLDLAQLYRQWNEEGKLTQWLKDLAREFPSDILPRRWLLSRPEILKDPRQAQELVEEIKSLEGEGGSQWRYEQARLWSNDSNDFKTHYEQTVKLLQENLLANPRDYDSRLLLANTYVKKGDQMSLAVATCQEAQRLAPNNVVVLAQTIAILMRANDYPGARRLLDQAQQQNLHSPDLDRLRLQSDVQSPNLTRREDAWEKVASRDPNDAAARLNLAWVRIQAKKYDEAQKILEALRAKTPDSMDVLGVQISLYVEQGKTDEAVRLCDQSVEKLRSAQAYGLRARVYIRLKQRLYESGLKDSDRKALRDCDEKVLDDFGRIIALDPKKAESWATRASYYRAIGRMREGLPDGRKALELAPDNLAMQKLAVLLLIDASLEGRDPSLLGESAALVEKALATLEKSPPANADDPRMRDYTELRMLKARVLMLKPTGPGVAEARRLLREVTTQQPKMADAWRWLAQLELDQEDPGRAADVALQGLTYNQDDGRLLLLRARAEKTRQPAVAALTLQGLLDHNPKNVEILVELADAYTRAGRAPQAVELLRQKLPGFAGPDRRLGEIALAETVYAGGQKDEAKALYEQLMQADPNDARPALSLAQCLRGDKLWTEMYQLVRRWLAAHPQDVDVATTIAQILAAAGDRQALQMGEDILRITVDRHPQSLGPLGLLAMMMQDAGRNEEAVRLYRKVLEIDPKKVAALNNLAWILCDQEGPPDQYQEALELAQRGLQIIPDAMDLLDTRGYAYYRLGDWDKATADFTKCLALYQPNSPVVATPRYHLALAYAAMKRKAEAVGQLQKALDSNRATVTRTAREQKDAGRVTYAIRLLKDALQLHGLMVPLRTALGLGDEAGPSAQELTEAKALLEELQKGI